MSGGWRDTFTKEDQKEGLLGYDDTAFYYFASSVLLCVVIPWTFNVVYNIMFPGKTQIERDFPTRNRAGQQYHYCQTSEMVKKVASARKEARRCTSSSLLVGCVKIAVLAALWGILYGVILQMGQEKEIKSFDPFDILEVSHGAATPDIKKAYRKLSLIYHPDKNPDDPLAASRFIQITKAYQALTDDVAKRNWEKFGNPDGPQTTKVGIGLPRFLLEKDNHLMILCAFFFLLLFVVPMTFICYYQKTKNYAANGVMIETLQFLGYHISEGSRVKNCPELVAASAESRNMETRPTDNTHMKALSPPHGIVEHKKRQFNVPLIVKNGFLVWAHMQRLHHLMSPELRKDCDQLLKYSLKITLAMIEIACMREWFHTTQAMIEFRRCLVQALDVKSSQLLQIPYFNEEVLKHCHKGKKTITSLSEFLSRDPEQRKGLAMMDPQQLADIEAFCSHVSNVEMKAKVTVEAEDDEEVLVVGDIATVNVQLVRKNLQENEAMGPVHAPLFPEPKFEEWWLILVDPSQSTRIIAWERIRDTERVVEEKLRFPVSRPGKQTLVLHAICDSYAGIDQKVDLNFNVQKVDEVKREIVVHPEDEELDLQPTLFQQFMGDFSREEESEEEEEKDDKPKSKVKKEAEILNESKNRKVEEEESDDDDVDDKKDNKSDDSSNSSSDSE